MGNSRDHLNQTKELKQQITELKRKKNQLQNEAKRRASWEQRKARTKRLIETGALAEKYFDLGQLPMDEREKVFRTFSGFVKGKMKKAEK